MALANALVQPPARLRTLPARAGQMLRPLWMLLFAFAILADIAGTIYVLRDVYEVQPTFDRRGLEYEVLYEGGVAVGTFSHASGKPGLPVESRIVAIGGRPVDPDARIATLVDRLEQSRQPLLAIDLRQPDGRIVRVQQPLAEPQYDPAAVRQRDIRMGARLLAGLMACGTLLACSLLLALRRRDDPVAMLFAFVFALMAATIDPPLYMWMGLGISIVDDVLAGTWFYLLLIALATFPDGVFVPKLYRWLIPVGIPLAVLLSLPDADGDVQALVGVLALLAILVGQVVRFRRLRGGIERQQLKWAAFGFGAGLILLLAVFVLIATIPEDSVGQSPWLSLAVVLLFSLGMAALPLGLLIALTRYRLWEADTIITRSAAYAVVTVVVGVVWAASTDLVKLVIEEVVGRESQAGATTVGAIIAAGIFSPTQNLVLGWTRKRFGGPLDRVKGAAKRLKSWGLTEPPAEVATRALAIIDEAVHPSAAAIVLDSAMSRDLIAARNISSADDPTLVEKIVLADEESPVGMLLLGRRSDGNRYNRQELEAVQEIIPSLAEALRVARSRYSRESMMQDRLDEMAARLAQLEGGAPKPA